MFGLHFPCLVAMIFHGLSIYQSGAAWNQPDGISDLSSSAGDGESSHSNVFDSDTQGRLEERVKLKQLDASPIHTTHTHHPPHTQIALAAPSPVKSSSSFSEHARETKHPKGTTSSCLDMDDAMAVDPSTRAQEDGRCWGGRGWRPIASRVLQLSPSSNNASRPLRLLYRFSSPPLAPPIITIIIIIDIIYYCHLPAGRARR